MIRAKGLCKSFKLYDSPSDRLREIVLRSRRHRLFTALDNVSFEVAEGETLGIIGRNGSGKSTLLKLLTGVLLPDAGHVRVDGRITGLLELGTGFNPEFSGLENIRLNGMLLGMGKEEIQAKRREIIDFTELGDFINEPLKTYSSGMVMRLAFSVAIHADPQAFVVDEALSVGDAYFQQKCMQRIKEFKKQGGSIIFVSHDMNAVKVLCNRVLFLDSGRVVGEGAPEEVINAYNYLLAKWGQGDKLRLEPEDGKACAFGTRQARIGHVRIMDAGGGEGDVFTSGGPMAVEVELEAEEDTPEVTVGLLIRDRLGQDIFGTNSFHLKQRVPFEPGRKTVARFAFDRLSIGPGQYTLTIALHSRDNHLEECYHWVDRVKGFNVVQGDGRFFVGLCGLDMKMDVFVKK